MEISVDHGKCLASGQCVDALPQIFDRRDEDGLSVVTQQHPTADLEEEIREAARACPTGAIRIVER